MLANADERLSEALQPELNLAQVETGTPVCRTLADVRSELRRLRRQVLAAAERVGCVVACTGTHPTGRWQEQRINPTKERYRFLEEQFQLTARQQLVNGCHVHIGVPDRGLAIAILDRCRLWLSPLLALTANSPFWMGIDSGYASYRTQVWSQWPMTGMPEPLGSWEGFEQLVSDLVATGVLQDASFLYWDVRPSARYPTLEFRVADSCLAVDESVMVAGLVRALAATCAADAATGGPVPRVRAELLRGARWRAARSGLDESLVDLASGRSRPAAEVVAGLLGHLRPALEELGDWDEIRALVDGTLSGGNGAARQRAAFARTGDLRAVVDMLVTETAAGVA